MAKNSKAKRIVEYMKTHDGITQMDAYDLCMATRLSAIIFDLKRQGHLIETTIETGLTLDGRANRYARYRLLDKE